MSADGFIAGPRGEHDWIKMDSSIDFVAQCGQFDTAITGRKIYESMVAMHGDVSLPGLDVVVLSKALTPVNSHGARIIQGDARSVVREMKDNVGGDIWLFGGGVLAAQLLESNLIDSIDLAIMPVVLGEGTRVFEKTFPTKLRLVDHVVLGNSGVAVFRFGVSGSKAAIPQLNYVKRIGVAR